MHGNLLCLDLSLRSTGYAVFDAGGKLVNQNKICPPVDYSNPGKILYIVTRLEPLYTKTFTLVIEDVYLGVTGVQNLVALSRLAGGVIYSWKQIRVNDPVFYTASQARKLVGLKGNCQKAEVQVFILKKFKFVPSRIIRQYEIAIDKLQLQKSQIKAEKAKTKTTKQIKKKRLGKVKYQFNKLSRIIEDKTGYGEDVCDAILLGISFFKKIK